MMIPRCCSKKKMVVGVACIHYSIDGGSSSSK